MALEAGPDHVTPYDRLALSDVQVESLLLTGGNERELTALFGADEYRDLVALAHRAHAHKLTADAQAVMIVPGIMGSQLGIRRAAPLPDDVLWLDPVDIGNGRLAALRLPTEGDSNTTAVIAMGPVLHSHLRLKLRLRAAGYAVELHHYDWRLSIEDTGRDLAKKLDERHARHTLIVAHSMGGLVARIALQLLPALKTRAILLGTPNLGSFAAVQALRGTYAVLRKVARLDHRCDAEQLADRVFRTFPSLYQLLPAAVATGDLDLCRPHSWPSTGPGPDAALLESAREFQKSLRSGDERLTQIVGVNQETVTGLERTGNDFRYTITRHGDGTVPLSCARLAGVRTYYTQTAHSELTRAPEVASALVDLLEHGQTSSLASAWATRSRAEAQITDCELRQTHVGKVDWSSLESDARRHYLQNLNDPPRLRLRVPS